MRHAEKERGYQSHLRHVGRKQDGYHAAPKDDFFRPRRKNIISHADPKPLFVVGNEAPEISPDLIRQRGRVGQSLPEFMCVQKTRNRGSRIEYACVQQNSKDVSEAEWRQEHCPCDGKEWIVVVVVVVVVIVGAKDTGVSQNCQDANNETGLGSIPDVSRIVPRDFPDRGRDKDVQAADVRHREKRTVNECFARWTRLVMTGFDNAEAANHCGKCVVA
mmetsp:Transcript_6506/g.15814  ORF Transcript_6506/g.15814 Transcript_6506/m.15814 type:complete len:218 (-) Transcript_6506:117-770(-)